MPNVKILGSIMPEITKYIFSILTLEYKKKTMDNFKIKEDYEEGARFSIACYIYSLSI